MTTASPDSSAQRSATRAPVGRPIKLQFDDSLDVVEGVCENISIGGMFLLVENVRPRGSLVRFELGFDDRTAIRGLGEVVWTDDRKQGAEHHPGLGIKFRFLEQRDRQLIFKLVSEHIKERLSKRQVSDADPPDGTAPAAAAAAPAPEPPVPEPPARDPEKPASAPAAAGGELPDIDAELESLTEAPSPAVSAPPAALSVEDPEEDAWTPEPVAGTFLDAGTADPGGSALETADLRGETFDDEELEPDHYPAPQTARRRPPPQSRRWVLWVALLAVAAAGAYLWHSGLGDGGPGLDGPGVDAPADPEGRGDAVETPAPPPPAGDTAPAETPRQTGTAPPPDPAPPVAPPPALTPPAEPGGAPFGRVLDISWKPAAGVTEIFIETDGTVAEGRYRHFRLGGDNPREVVRLLDVRENFRRGQMEVGGPLVERIRTGFHRRRGGDELHVVLDLADPAAEVRDVEVQGSRLVVRVGRP